MSDTISDRFPIGKVPEGLVTWFLDEAAKNDPAYIGRFIGLMTTLDWSDRLGEIRLTRGGGTVRTAQGPDHRVVGRDDGGSGLPP